MMTALILVGCAVMPFLSNVARAEDDAARALWNATFAASRSKTGASEAQRIGEALVGVTLWRLRAARQADPAGVRLLVHEQQQEQSFTPERVALDAPLALGDRVRIGIECARSGYLYVIDRERYASGELGDPYLAFPSRRIRGGDNQVRGGRVIEIPDWSDRPPYLTLQRSRAGHVGEMLTLIVAPQPLPGLMSDGTPLRLDAAQVRQWEQKWGAKVTMLNSSDGPGKTLTPAEKDSASGGPLLRADDPLPQRLYKVPALPGQPVLLSVQLNLGR